MAKKKRTRLVVQEGKEYEIPVISRGRITKEDEKVAIAEVVAELYATDKYSLSECLKKVGVNRQTWYNWTKESLQVLQIYKKGEAEKDEAYRHNLKERARTALERSIDGYEYKTTKREGIVGQDGNIKPTKVIEETKFIKPNPTLIIFALSNADKENFQRSPEPGTTLNNQFNIQVNTPGPGRAPRTSESDIEDPGNLEDVIQVKGRTDGE